MMTMMMLVGIPLTIISVLSGMRLVQIARGEADTNLIATVCLFAMVFYGTPAGIILILRA
jgi:hypothetical protein